MVVLEEAVDIPYSIANDMVVEEEDRLVHSIHNEDKGEVDNHDIVFTFLPLSVIYLLSFFSSSSEVLP